MTAEGGPEVLRVLSTGIAALREKAEEALGALGVATAEAPGERAVREGRSPGASSARPAEMPVPGGGADLAIRGYDDLSASQVVDHLDGLARADLEAIRLYEATHRARNTILGKIEQLTRGS
jgi:hypothetical protein